MLGLAILVVSSLQAMPLAAELAVG